MPGGLGHRLKAYMMGELRSKSFQGATHGWWRRIPRIRLVEAGWTVARDGEDSGGGKVPGRTEKLRDQVVEIE